MSKHYERFRLRTCSVIRRFGLLGITLVAAAMLDACIVSNGMVPRFTPNQYSVRGEGAICLRPITYAPGVEVTGEPEYETWDEWDLPYFTRYLGQELTRVGYSVNPESAGCRGEEAHLVCSITEQHFVYGGSFFPWGPKVTLEAAFRCKLAAPSRTYFDKSFSSSKNSAYWFFTLELLPQDQAAARATEMAFEEVTYRLVVEVVRARGPSSGP